LDNLGTREEQVDDGRAESHVAPKAEYAGDLIRVGIDPGLRHTQKRCHRVSLEQLIKAAKPMLDFLATESEVRAEPPEAGNLVCVRAHPCDGHDKDVSDILVGQKGRTRRDWRRGELVLKLCQAFLKARCRLIRSPERKSFLPLHRFEEIANDLHINCHPPTYHQSTKHTLLEGPWTLRTNCSVQSLTTVPHDRIFSFYWPYESLMQIFQSVELVFLRQPYHASEMGNCHWLVNTRILDLLMGIRPTEAG
jgi:hypothetical protein